jgi:hypothetical protein
VQRAVLCENRDYPTLTAITSAHDVHIVNARSTDIRTRDVRDDHRGRRRGLKIITADAI